MNDAAQTIVLAGGSGDLGGRLARSLVDRGAHVHALVHSGTPDAKRDRLSTLGATVVEVNFDDQEELTNACRGATCVVSALNGLRPTIIGMQGRILQAVVASGVPRFIPSDFSLDYTRTRPGDNRNMDLRREFMAQIDDTPIKATSILNGAFADMLTGQAPIVLHGIRKILYWGDADQPIDFTTKDDVARYTAAAALDPEAPRFLRIAGDVVTPRSLADTMTEVTGKRFRLFRAGGVGRLSVIIRVVRRLAPQPDAVFSVWQGMQYLRDMASGRGKLQQLDNDRYRVVPWTSARDVLDSALVQGKQGR
ncbi:MAG: aromatic alcohol reductase [Janthinobacterium lividum]